MIPRASVSPPPPMAASTLPRNPSRLLVSILLVIPVLFLVFNGFLSFSSPPIIPLPIPQHPTLSIKNKNPLKVSPQDPQRSNISSQMPLRTATNNHPLLESPPTPHSSNLSSPIPAKFSSQPDKTSSSGRRTKSQLKLLRPTPKSHMFATRARRFFTNSSCNPRFFMTWISSLDTFTQRELLVVESLFKAHKDACLLFLSAALDSTKGRRLLQPFIDLGFKVIALSPDYPFLLQDTPAEHWFKQLVHRHVHPGKIWLGQNLSNLLRLAALYKYGGAYIDTDVIVIKSFCDLRNVIGAQTATADRNWTRLNNAVLVFDKKHPFLFKFMKEFAEMFDGSKWGHNGPYLVTKVVQREGGVGVRVASPEVFYPVLWDKIGEWFKGPRDGRGRRWVDERVRRIKERSYGMHLWNRESKGMVVEEGSVVERIMRERCLLCTYSIYTSSQNMGL